MFLRSCVHRLSGVSYSSVKRGLLDQARKHLSTCEHDLIDSPALPAPFQKALRYLSYIERSKDWNLIHENISKAEADMANMVYPASDIQNISLKIGDIKQKSNYFKEERENIKNLKHILDCANSESEKGLRSDVLEEAREVAERIFELWLKLVCENEHIHDCILEINCGAGGMESQDWVVSSKEMYLRWAYLNNYETNVIHETSEGQGAKHCTIKISGRYAYDFVKNESGIHRYTRMSPYSPANKVHTSFISVLVTPLLNEKKSRIGHANDIIIKPKDIKIDFVKSSGPGGQKVNKTESAVRLMHIPTRIMINCQSERDQHENKTLAMEILRSKLFALHEEELRKEKEKDHINKPKASWGNKIRNYSMQSNIVKDLRTGYESRNVYKVLSGDNLHAFMTEALIYFSRIAPVKLY